MTVVLTGGLDRCVSAFLRVEVTHAPAVSNLYRAILRVFIFLKYYLRSAALGFDGLGVSAIVPQGAELFKEGRGGERRRRASLRWSSRSSSRTRFCSGLWSRSSKTRRRSSRFSPRTGSSVASVSWSRTSNTPRLAREI